MLLNSISSLPRKLKNLGKEKLHFLITGVETTEKVVALTFDDGPHPYYTPAILDLLDRYNAKATFFVVGELAKKYPSILQRIRSSGHAIGNHTFSHAPIPLVGRKRRIQEINTTQQLLQEGDLLFRPPWGFVNFASFLDIKLMQYRLICWDTAIYDWLNPTASEVFERLESDVKKGSIILLHDNLYNTIKPEYLPRNQLIEGLERYLQKYASKYQFLTIPELLKHGKIKYEYGLINKKSKEIRIPKNILEELNKVG